MIYIAADKHGFKTIWFVEDFLKSKGVEYTNVGASKEDEEVRLEDIVPAVVNPILTDGSNRGILSCGTGVGVEVGANKFGGIRACLATDKKVAEWSRVYDDCNVLCLVGWESTKGQVEKIVKAWLAAEYDGNEKRRAMFETFSTWH
jgi:ribose 5-phosphate isomerase B